MAVIIVTGTPATGKTTVAKKLAKLLDYRYLDVNRLIGRKGIAGDYDYKRAARIVDVKRLGRALVEEIKKGKNIVIDSHLSHFLPERYVDACIVTKCDLKVLNKRLKRRGYNTAKARENLDAEIFDVCYEEAASAGHSIVSVDTTKGIKMKELLQWLKAYGIRKG